MSLTRGDIDLALEALQYARRAFEGYVYAVPEMRAERLADVDRVVAELRQLRLELAGAGPAVVDMDRALANVARRQAKAL